MKSPEMPSQAETPSQEKWNNLSVQKCKAVYDVLAKLESAGTLPEGKTADDPSLKKAGDIMDYAERVLSDDTYWKSSPEEFEVPSPFAGAKKFYAKEELRTKLSELIQGSR